MKSEKFYVLNKDNKYFEFNSWEELVKEFRKTWNRKIPDLWFGNIGHNFNDSYVIPPPFGRVIPYERKKVDYVIFDSQWRVVRKEELISAVESYEPTYKYWRARRQPHVFRCDPVPGINCSRWGSYFRHPMTIGEIKANICDAEFVRGKRKWLPTSYDDVKRSDKFIKRSWKKQKKRKQWM